MGQFLEAITLSWFRFELVLAWLFAILLSVAARPDSLLTTIALIVLSPAMAFLLWILFKLTGWVIYFIPGVGMVWGIGRILFLLLLSKVVVEPAPAIERPLWFVR